MADKKAARKKKKKDSEEDKLDNDETAVAKYLRWNFTTKKSTFYGEQVEYFTGNKAIDFLMESKWATGKAPKSKVQFPERDAAVDFMDRMLVLGLFSRVQRIKKDVKKVEKKPKDGSPKEVRKRKPEETKDGSPKEVRKRKLEKAASSEGKEEAKDGKKKRKVKYILEPHDEQYFVDDDEAYMWIYDPVHPKSFFMGVLLVLGVIACCLFPLWPDSFRVYSWYLSVMVAMAIGALFSVGLLRYVVFGAVWVVTCGKLSFWFLPNLTAECGFFESFKPGYEYEYRGDGKTKTDGNETVDKDPEEKTTSSAEVTQETIADETNENSSEKDSRDSDAENEATWVKVKKADAERPAEKC